MNCYVVLEGTADKKIYSSWIGLINSALTIVHYPGDAVTNNIYLLSGRGYPEYFDMIKRGVADLIEFPQYDFLIIAGDSESLTRSEMYNEINDFVSALTPTRPFKIIVQHFCIETWALGNRALVRKKPSDKLLRQYINDYNVHIHDPEQLPERKAEGLNRAKHALKYLEMLVEDAYHGKRYMKSNPYVVQHPKFFFAVQKRFQDTLHIRSFEDFINAFT